MKKEPEPLIELLYQEFAKTDPLIIERIIKTTSKWLEQKHKLYKKECKIISKKLGDKDTGNLVSKAYPQCIDSLLEELDRSFNEK